MHWRPGLPLVRLGDTALVADDVVWATEVNRLVRYEDSDNGLRAVAEVPGAFTIEQASRDAVLVSESVSFDVHERRVITADADGGLAVGPPISTASGVALVDGGLLEWCHVPPCGDALSVAFDRVFFLDGTGEVLRWQALDGGDGGVVELGPGQVRRLMAGVVMGMPLGVKTPEGHMALLAGMSGEPYPLWFGSDVVAVGRNLVFLRSHQGDELYAVQYDF